MTNIAYSLPNLNVYLSILVLTENASESLFEPREANKASFNQHPPYKYSS